MKEHVAPTAFRDTILNSVSELSVDASGKENVFAAISNCVPPVMRGNDVVLREAFRVLKPGGRLVTTSWLVDDGTPDESLSPDEALSPKGGWKARMGLQLLRQKDYFAKLRATGFAEVEIAAKSPTPIPHKSKLMVVARKGK